VGSAADPGGNLEDLASSDILNVRDTSFAILWGFEVRKHTEQGGERRSPAFHTQWDEGATSAGHSPSSNTAHTTHPCPETGGTLTQSSTGQKRP